MEHTTSRKNERGAALLTALILLIAVTLLTLGSLATSLLELRMAGNDEAQMTASQSAQSALENIIAVDNAARKDPSDANLHLQHFKLAGLTNETNCTPAWPGDCKYKTVTLSEPLDHTSKNAVRITRISDVEFDRGGGCANGYKFILESLYDRSASGQGKAEIVQGYTACSSPPLQESGVPQDYTHEDN